ncbi:hypothetical protein BKA70DRAFT_225380 [Coprinopsis sp. MPI-PUGE-AT-0042]|nr:hypothetical protein BKA70DRAFT_225380 [Coprinopsis sp. MPI-PUGE-AT-0042]
MNGDHHYYNDSSSNAIAGPSKQPEPSIHSPTPTFGVNGAPVAPSSSSPHPSAASSSASLFLPPPAPAPPKLHLDSTQDLLARLHLHSAYDRYVRPVVLPGNEPTLSGMGAGVPGTPGDKGKGKEVDGGMETPGQDAGMGGGDGEGDDEDGKGEKRRKNSYKHLIKGLPGKHSLRKDDYLTTIMLVPPKQRSRIAPFDVHTQEDAFTVSPEGLKGWNINALVAESAQAREDRKKRKELKRLAKLQQHQPLQLGGPMASGTATPLRAMPTPASGTPRPAGVATPQRVASGTRPATSTAGTPRPGSAIPRPGPTIAQPNAAPPQNPQPPNTSATPRPSVPRPGSTVPRPGSTVPRPGSAAGLPPRLASAKPQPVGTPGAGLAGFGDGPRGKKREWDDGATTTEQVNGSNGHGLSNGVSNGNGVHPGANLPKAVVNAKAGIGLARPRPLKKPRMDGPNPHVQQQPTPQGV